MASNTLSTWYKRKWHLSNAGRKRKTKDSRRSTLTYSELFAGLGEPGKPAPKSPSK